MRKLAVVLDGLLHYAAVCMGVPLCLAAGLWSITNITVLGIDAPAAGTGLRLSVIAVAVLLASIVCRARKLNSKAEMALEYVGQTSFFRCGKTQSISQVDLMLDEVRQLLETRTSDVIIYEAHLEPTPPAGIIGSHKRVVAFAARKGRSLQWQMLVGQEGNEKEEWVRDLKQQIADSSQGRYTVRVLNNTKPSLNFIVIPCIDQTYLGLGDWLGGDNTGGVWVKSKHFASAMAGVFRKLQGHADG